MPPALSVFKGVADIVDQLADIHPQDWSNYVYQYMPLGKKKGMMTMHIEALGKQTTESQVFNYWEQPFNQRHGTVIDVYDGPGLTNATAGASAALSVRNIAMTALNAKLWNVHDCIIFTKLTNQAYTRVVGRVISVHVLDDASSYVSVILPKADTNDVLSAASIKFDPSAPAYPNKTELPGVRMEKPTKFQLVCSNRLTAWGLTIHEIKEKSRLQKSIVGKVIEDAMKDHLIASELGNLFGVLEDDDPSQYQSQGLIDVLNERTTAGVNVINFKTDTNYLGSATGSFVQLGYELMRGVGEFCSRNVGAGSWNVYCGGLALEAVDAMITDRAHYEIKTSTDDYGFHYKTVHTQRGDFNFFAHPLFVNSESFQHTMLGVRPELCTVRSFFPLDYIEPADFGKLLELSKSGVKLDGQNWNTEMKGGWFECKGTEFYNADAQFIIDGVGLSTDFDRV
jgi:hypothetical protein